MRPGQVRHSWDYYVRSVTTALLALALVGSALFQLLRDGAVNPILLAWAGLIVGVYFGSHVATNSHRRPPDGERE